MTASIEASVIVLNDSHFKLEGRTNIFNFGGNTQKRMAIGTFTRKIFGLFKGNRDCSMYSYKQKISIYSVNYSMDQLTFLSKEH